MKLSTRWLTGSPGRKLTRNEKAARRAFAELDRHLTDALQVQKLMHHVTSTVSAVARAGGDPADVPAYVAETLRAGADMLEAEYAATFRQAGEDHVRALVRRTVN